MDDKNKLIIDDKMYGSLRTNEWMDGWVVGWKTNGWMSGWMDGLMDKWVVDRQIDRQIYKWHLLYINLDKWQNGWIDRDKQIDNRWDDVWWIQDGQIELSDNSIEEASKNDTISTSFSIFSLILIQMWKHVFVQVDRYPLYLLSRTIK